MDQFSQTNDLQQAINNVANNSDVSSVQDQLGVPPVPPMPPVGSAPVDELPPIAPVEPMPIAPPMPESPAPEAAQPAPMAQAQPVEPQPLVPPEEPKEAPKSVEEPQPVVGEEKPASVEEPSDLAVTKENILKDLMPLMDKVDTSAEEKYMIYRDAMETLHDKNLITNAYKAASKIEDENRKAEALIELMKAIDNV